MVRLLVSKTTLHVRCWIPCRVFFRCIAINGRHGADTLIAIRPVNLIGRCLQNEVRGAELGSDHPCTQHLVADFCSPLELVGIFVSCARQPCVSRNSSCFLCFARPPRRRCSLGRKGQRLCSPSVPGMTCGRSLVPTTFTPSCWSHRYLSFQPRRHILPRGASSPREPLRKPLFYHHHLLSLSPVLLVVLLHGTHLSFNALETNVRPFAVPEIVLRWRSCKYSTVGTNGRALRDLP